MSASVIMRPATAPVSARFEPGTPHMFVAGDGFTGADADAASSSRAGSPSLRLTRRGRLVLGTLTVLAVAFLLGWVAMLGAPRADASTVGSASEFGYVIVLPGQSLWSVATSLDPSADPRDLIAEIVRLNQLSDSAVQAGEAIAVPLRYTEVPGVISADQLGMPR